MLDLLRQLLLALNDFLYSIIPDLYDMFYSLADGTIFESSDIKSFSTNLYILISVLMLFAFAIKIIEAIINPDLLVDQKKGVAGVFKRSIIGMGIIVVTPFAFSQLYKIQDAVLENSLIEKLVIGVRTNDNSSETGIDDYGFSTTECTNGHIKASKSGQIMAGLSLYVFLYPEGTFGTGGNYYVQEDKVSKASKYNDVINCDITKIDKLSSIINDESDDEYLMHFDGFCALAFGLFLIYQLIILCMDTALRLVKLSFLQLISPIIVLAYIMTNDETINKYYKEIGVTYSQVFIRIAAFSFYILILSKIPSIISDFDSEGGKIWTTVFLIIGALQFVKIVPDLIGKLFGISIKNRGGIKGRLGDMAGVGGLAQKAWHALPRLGALGAGVAAYGAAKGIGYLGNNARRGLRYVGRNGLLGTGLNGGRALLNGARNIPDNWERLRNRMGNAAGGAFGRMATGAQNFAGRSRGVSGYAANIADLGLAGVQNAFKFGGRALKFAGRGLSAPWAAGKAAIASGSILGAISAGTKAYQSDKNYLDRYNERFNRYEQDQNEEMLLDEYGNVIYDKTSPNKSQSIVSNSKLGYKRGAARARRTFDAKDADTIIKYADATLQKDAVSQLKTHFDDSNTNIDTLISFLNEQNRGDLSSRLGELKKALNKDISSDNAKAISTLLDSSDFNKIVPANFVNAIKGSLSKFDSARGVIETDFRDLLQKGAIRFDSYDDLKISTKNMETAQKAAEKNYTRAKENAKSDNSKGDSYVDKMDSIISAHSNLSSQYASNIGNVTENSSIKTPTVAPPSPSVTSASASSSTSVSPTIELTPTGDGMFKTSSGIVIPASAARTMPASETASTSSTATSPVSGTTATSSTVTPPASETASASSTATPPASGTEPIKIDNSDLLSVMNEMNMNLRENTSSVSSSVDSLANKISGETRNAMKENTDRTIENQNKIARESLNREKDLSMVDENERNNGM